LISSALGFSSALARLACHCPDGGRLVFMGRFYGVFATFAVNQDYGGGLKFGPKNKKAHRCRLQRKVWTRDSVKNLLSRPSA
jgi:hypothetical protein